MNYTTLAKVKAAFGAEETTDDDMLKAKITEASRAWDTTLCKAEADYFKLETVTNEVLKGLITKDGDIVTWAKKVIVNSVTKFEYRFSPRTDWVTADLSAVVINNHRQVTAYGIAGLRSVPCWVRLTYSGGYGTEATPYVSLTGMPEDVINAVTVLAVRFYKEEKSGLTDAIGVAELGTLQYTKAIPERVFEMARPYRRLVV